MRNFPHLIIGIVLVATAAFFLVPAHGWKPLPPQPVASHHEVQPSQEATAADPALADSARLHVYGVLKPAGTDSAPEREAPAPAPAYHSPMDRVVDVPDHAPPRFLHKRFSLRIYEGFAFVVPAGAIRPRLEGTFKSFAGGNGGGSGDVEVLLLNQQEFDELVHGEAGTATFTTDPSNSGEVKWALSSSISDPRTYYLVFHNPSTNSLAKLVDADFSMNSD